MADAGKFKLVILAYGTDLPGGIETEMKWLFFFSRWICGIMNLWILA